LIDDRWWWEVDNCGMTDDGVEELNHGGTKARRDRGEFGYPFLTTIKYFEYNVCHADEGGISNRTIMKDSPGSLLRRDDKPDGR